MKICKLKLKNLNSFREPVDIDFENPPLNDASLVAITGPTGSGKTTLLDAICVALYGKTPRLSGQGSQNPNHLISHGEKEGFAEVHFMVNNTRYLATWSAKQKGSPKVGLFYADNDKLITDKLSTRGKSLGSSQKTVSEEVESILGLDFGAFKRSIMLAQGEFAAFLKASDEERRTILEATAGIGIYDELKKALNVKVNEVEAATANVLDKLNRIPEASLDQLKGAEGELKQLKAEVKALEAKYQRIQEDQDRETERKADFERLASSEKRQAELSEQQLEIEAFEAERRLAEKAQGLRSEKDTFDKAESELESATVALHSATMERTEAENQMETDQTVFREKSAAYQTAANERDQKMPIYTAAKLDVSQAKNRFAEAEKRESGLANLNDQIDALDAQLSDRQTKQTELQEKIDKAQRFLEDNPLPSDRQQRLTRTAGLSEQLKSQEKQLQTELTNKANAEEDISSLKQEIEKLSNVQQKRLSEKSEAETAFEGTSTQLNKLLATGTSDEWTARKQQASKAQPIAQRYEATQDDLADAENQLNTLNDTAAVLDAELEQIQTGLATQIEVCQRAAEVVRHCEAEREFVLLANPINQLRQHLHTGEPCLVCGATEHPSAGVVEPENEERLRRAEDTLAAAKTDADAAQAELQVLKTKQIQTEENQRNTADQIEICTTQIETLRDEVAKFLAEWQAIYPDADVSSKWVSKQFDRADTTLADITEVEQNHTKASNAFQIISQQLETCENDLKRETDDLNGIETQLKDLSKVIADLQADIASTETRFWESMPDGFHDISPAVAVKQFDDKIEEIGQREGERDSAKTQLQVLNANIEADRDKFQDLKESHEGLKTEIDRYRSEGDAFLDAARQKTDGLEAEIEIDAAMNTLETELQARVQERDDTEQQLQNSRNLLTQKRTTHEIGEAQFKVSAEKLEIARVVYFDRLSDAGFDSPEAHDSAFRDEGRIQELIDQIDAHANEKQQLEVEITKLRTRFEETPFDPEALKGIDAQVEDSGEQLQAAQQKVGAQQQRIDDLKDALKKREALGAEISKVEQELKRWKRLQDTIPRNDLRDFALEIMFKQMSRLANDQLKYLTSERYQLKVKGIGNLTVIDRWNANEERPVETLSGGESFLTSLALALALADLSRGRAQLNSLFLDEGFGTLDTETLDIAIAALEGLRMQGRSIFLISHIQELTRRLPVKINVRKRGNGGSSIEVRG